MGRYTIKDLEQLSGIKAHTLRVWEQRYSIIEPQRTETNIRFYDDDDVRLLLNISFLNRNGYKISHIAKLSESEIQEMVMKISDSNLEFPNQVNALVIAMVNLDEAGFEKIIATNTLQFGFERMMMNIVFPFMERIGVLWQTGSINPAHEHFITNLVRQKMIVAIDGQVSTHNPAAKKYLLFLPEGELHEISLLFAAYLIKSRYNRVIYLGQSLPLKDIQEVIDVHRPDFVMSIITSYPAQEDVGPYLDLLQEGAGDAQVLLSGYQALQYEGDIPEKITILRSVNEMIEFVDNNSQQPVFVPSNGNGNSSNGTN